MTDKELEESVKKSIKKSQLVFDALNEI